MKAKRKRGKSQQAQVFKAKAAKAGPVRVVPWIEREEEKARLHLRAILAG